MWARICECMCAVFSLLLKIISPTNGVDCRVFVVHRLSNESMHTFWCLLLRYSCAYILCIACICICVNNNFIACSFFVNLFCSHVLLLHAILFNSTECSNAVSRNHIFVIAQQFWANDCIPSFSTYTLYNKCICVCVRSNFCKRKFSLGATATWNHFLWDDFSRPNA